MRHEIREQGYLGTSRQVSPWAEVRATLPAAPVANADETRWSQADLTRWL
ncbi:MAG: hypothetical protein ACRDI2_14980 [Chloroflexota bacterium]